MSLQSQAVTPQMRVLFLAANPDSTAPLHAGREVRRIRERLAGTAHGSALEILERWAIRPSDLQQALIQVQPHIVHFSGHGSIECELMLEGDDGSPMPVGKRVLSELFRLRGAGVRLVVLSACHSLPQAEAIAEHVGCAIGMRRAIGSEAATEFSAALYHALGSGDSIRRAFESAQLHLEVASIPEHRTPLLVVRRDGVDIDQSLVGKTSRRAAPIQSSFQKSSSISVPETRDEPKGVLEASSFQPGASQGEYQLGELLGRGKSSEVRAGIHKLSGREVAIKILSRTYLTTPEALKRFFREVSIALSIKHPNVCEYIDCGKTERPSSYFLVMERLWGETFIDRTRRLGPLSLAELRRPVEEALLALEAIHRQGVIHRNIQPGNIFLDRWPNTSHERVKIIGFGTAKVIHTNMLTKTLTQVTSSRRSTIGEVFYASPEQLTNGFVGYRSDLYSLGVTIFQALSGQLPYGGRDPKFHLVVRAMLTQRALSLEECTGVSWPPSIERLLERMLERNPETRIQTATEALEAWRAMPATSEPCFERPK